MWLIEILSGNWVSATRDSRRIVIKTAWAFWKHFQTLDQQQQKRTAKGEQLFLPAARSLPIHPPILPAQSLRPSHFATQSWDLHPSLSAALKKALLVIPWRDANHSLRESSFSILKQVIVCYGEKDLCFKRSGCARTIHFSPNFGISPLLSFRGGGHTQAYMSSSHFINPSRSSHGKRTMHCHIQHPEQLLRPRFPLSDRTSKRWNRALWIFMGNRRNNANDFHSPCKWRLQCDDYGCRWLCICVELSY